MEKRIGAALILIERKDHVDMMNSIISDHSSIILGRQGVPVRDQGVSIITLILEGSNDQINSLTGKLGKLEGVQVKSMLAKQHLA